MSFLDNLRQGLSKSRKALNERFAVINSLGAKLEAAAGEELEATLLGADLGSVLTAQVMEDVRSHANRGKGDAAQLKPLLRDALGRVMKGLPASRDLWAGKASVRPQVTLMVGVNGSGKTTTTGKIASRWAAQGQKVLLAAGDTFRAAAVEQLESWAERAGVEMLSQKTGADPSALAFDAVRKACAQGFDRLIVDTAGRLQTKTNLMEELKKIHRVCGKALQGCPHHVLLVLDGSTGQNMASQVRQFNAVIPLTGLVITKLDGSSKAGAVLSVMRELPVPVEMIGVGEGLGDLQPFNPVDFINALVAD